MEKFVGFFSVNILIGVCLLTVGHILGWYTHNLQFVYDFWKDRPVLSNIIFGVPCGFAFWFATKYMMESTGELWSVRFIAFALSYLTFPIMTWYYLGESMFTTKTIICTILAFMIIITQVLLR
tara:strand:- start:71 stop:439 length:369 start_codon:yes stop_codon:yes gene_type:complete